MTKNVKKHDFGPICPGLMKYRRLKKPKKPEKMVHMWPIIILRKSQKRVKKGTFSMVPKTP